MSDEESSPTPKKTVTPRFKMPTPRFLALYVQALNNGVEYWDDFEDMCEKEFSKDAANKNAKFKASAVKPKFVRLMVAMAEHTANQDQHGNAGWSELPSLRNRPKINPNRIDWDEFLNRTEVKKNIRHVESDDG